ncbi:NADH pyrophosphatase [Schizosaccharomyces cryophilus OY26]|uniref:NAD(+) diphosphatase n=1 Tax=Schizosaccharomyces cryophilus (strain OY26 / ATCC MYA-4695 / CBS 11777 / NBRC 106824 / NRRL Y48691) TaxID=653667 RepID=S9XA32_SCHCR|nr:NADH pyrophosphatase [Schizosaccharomyces cryophilus OY26]EPY53992.1 NADH pyrophosphatase [Schizosaccharomyces cryophilus OY26]
MNRLTLTRQLELPSAPTQFFSGNPLNRLSFLRSNREFLQKAFCSPTTKFLPFSDLNPAVAIKEENLFTLSYPQISKYFHVSPFEISEKQLAEKYSNHSFSLPTLVFLGNNENGNGNQGWDQNNVFAIDVTEIEELQRLVQDNGAIFVNLRNIFSREYSLKASESGVCAFGRSLLDWIYRYKFCPGCGSRNMPVQGGTKLVCTNAVMNPSSTCPSKQGSNNYQFPRTDPCVIMGVLSHDMNSIALGRAAKHPPGLYACLAGFLEPGESIEEAVSREVYEESGLEIEKVIYYTSQPWPFPQSLMLACFAIAKEDTEISLDKDLELENVRFFSREEVLKSLEWSSDSQAPPIRFPPEFSIAKNLIKAFAYNKW